MYQPRTPGYRKQDATARWNRPDRVFFACGACHILAYAFHEKFPEANVAPLWIKPALGYTGNHIVVSGDGMVFDYHGVADQTRYIARTIDRAGKRWPGWSCSLKPLAWPDLISEALSKRHDGLWLREPEQFLHDALPRARQYLDRFRPDVFRPLLGST